MIINYNYELKNRFLRFNKSGIDGLKVIQLILVQGNIIEIDSKDFGLECCICLEKMIINYNYELKNRFLRFNKSGMKLLYIRQEE